MKSSSCGKRIPRLAGPCLLRLPRKRRPPIETRISGAALGQARGPNEGKSSVSLYRNSARSVSADASKEPNRNCPRHLRIEKYRSPVLRHRLTDRQRRGTAYYLTIGLLDLCRTFETWISLILKRDTGWKSGLHLRLQNDPRGVALRVFRVFLFQRWTT